MTSRRLFFFLWLCCILHYLMCEFIRPTKFIWRAVVIGAPPVLCRGIVCTARKMCVYRAWFRRDFRFPGRLVGSIEQFISYITYFVHFVEVLCNLVGHDAGRFSQRCVYKYMCVNLCIGLYINNISLYIDAYMYVYIYIYIYIRTHRGCIYRRIDN